MKGNCLAIVRTVLLAVRRIEGESGIRPSDGRIMFIQPRLAEDDVVGDGGNIQADRFFVSSGLEDDGVKLGDGAPVGALTICKD